MDSRVDLEPLRLYTFNPYLDKTASTWSFGWEIGNYPPDVTRGLCGHSRPMLIPKFISRDHRPLFLL